MTWKFTWIRGARLLIATALTATIACVGLMPGQVALAETPSGYVQIITLDLDNGGGPAACQLARVDLGSSGGVTPIGPVFDIATDGCPFDMARRDGRLYGILTRNDQSTPSSLVGIDPHTGARTPIGSLGFPTGLAGLSFDDDEHLWFYAQSGDPSCAGGSGQSCLYRVDRTTGAPTLIGSGPADAQVLGATTTCTRVLADLIFTNDGPPSSQLTTLDTTTAALSPKPNTYGGILMTGLEHDPDHTLYGLGVAFGENGPQAPSSYRIDSDTGLATKIAEFPLATGQLLAALAIDEPECGPDEPTTTTTAPPAEPIASPVRFTG